MRGRKKKGDYVIRGFNKIEEMQLVVVLIIRRVLRERALY